MAILVFKINKLWRIMSIKNIDESNFEEEVLKNESKVLVYFTADWCGVCKTIKPILNDVANEQNSVKFVEIDSDNCLNLTKTYLIKSLPTLVLFSGGKRIGAKMGSIKKQDLIKFILDSK